MAIPLFFVAWTGVLALLIGGSWHDSHRKPWLIHGPIPVGVAEGCQMVSPTAVLCYHQAREVE